MNEQYVMDLISEALNNAKITHESNPGAIYIDLPDGTYTITINKCEE